MSFDLRLPVGMMFTVFGLILTAVVGLFGSPALAEQSLGINMNPWWGLFQLVFGGLMLFFAKGIQSRIGESPAAPCSVLRVGRKKDIVCPWNPPPPPKSTV